MHLQGIKAAAIVLLLIGLFTGPVGAKDIPEKEPSAKRAGKLCKWTSKNGIVYHYRLPKGYDPKKGASLTLILHGSNLTHGWGFANHSAKTFRPDDIVVSPDGTTSNGQGGFNSLGRPADAKKFHAFHEEMKSSFKVNATYLYGHSQGSFFAFYYAGEYPDDVQGVVGHASGVWTQTKLSKKGHHQAVVLMHGTQDPVVPYLQSAGGFTSYTERKYPYVRLRSLEWWNHWPAEHNGPVPHTSQQLAWVEGMTTADPARLAACWEVLGEVKNPEQHDYVATYTLGRRLASLEEAPSALQKKAKAAVTVVDELVKAHIDAMGFSKDIPFDDAEAVARFIYFMRRFDGIPACDEYVESFLKVLTKHQKKGVSNLRKYFPAMRKGDKADAFKYGVAAIAEGYLWPECQDKQIRENLKKWRKEAKKLKVSKKVMKEYDEVVPAFDKALASGWKAFSRTNAKKGKL